MDKKERYSATFPYPIPEYGAEPYWDACNEQRLMMQRCEQCVRFRWHPSPRCGDCGCERYSWELLSGRGRINTWTVVTHPVHPAAVEKVPYIVVVIELEEQVGLTMVSNLIDCDVNCVDFNQPVEVDFVTHPIGQKIPVFRLA